jgi:peptide/nickel transport system substrate-binding protein
VTLSQIRQLSKAKDVVQLARKGGEAIGPLGWLAFNLKRKPFDDVRVRQAIAHAIDKDFIVKSLHQGNTKVATGPIAPGSPFYSDKVERYKLDLKKAAALLDAAGLKPDGSGKRFAMTLDFLPNTPDNSQTIAEYLRPQLKKIGIEVTVRTSPDFPTWARRVGTHDFDATMDGAFNYGDPVIGVHRTYLSSNIKPGVIWSNTQNYVNPKVDELLAQATVETRCREAQEALRRVPAAGGGRRAAVSSRMCGRRAMRRARTWSTCRSRSGRRWCRTTRSAGASEAAAMTLHLNRRQAASALFGLGLADGSLAQATGGDRTLVVGMPSIIRHLNPAIQAAPVNLVGAQIFASPLRFDRDWTPQPYLAESWVFQDDGKSLLLRLVGNATFHDGRPVTSDDVAFSLMAIKASHPFSTMLAPVERVDTPTPRLAIIRLKHEHPALLLALSPALCPIMPRHVFGDGPELRTHPRNINPVGSGPFKLVGFVPNQHITLEKHSGFFLPDRPRVDRLVFRVLTDPTTQLLELERGGIHMTAAAVPATHIERARGMAAVRVLDKGGEAIGPVGWLEFNLRRKPFDDVRVRRAIAHAIDRDFIVKALHRGTSQVATGPIAPGTPYHSTQGVEPYRLDLARAERLLDEAGLKRGAGGSRMAMTLDYQPGIPDNYETIANYLKPQLKKIGIDVTVRTSPASSSATPAPTSSSSAAASSAADVDRTVPPDEDRHHGDVVLAKLERRQLTCGTTWHAAGLVPQLRATRTLTELAKYTSELLICWRPRPGQATGFKQNGSVAVALSRRVSRSSSAPARWAAPSACRSSFCRPAEVLEKLSAARRRGVVGGLWTPNDGQTNPVDTTRPTPRAPGSAGPRCSRTRWSRTSWSRTAALSAFSSNTTERGRIAGPDRRARLRHVERRDRPQARHPPGTAGRRALLHRHRADGQRAARPAGAARARRVRLLQGGRRQAAARRLRAGGQALGAGRHSRGLLLRRTAADIDHFEPVLSAAHGARCRCCRPPASPPGSTDRRASRPMTATCSARRPRCATCSSPAASTRSASRAPAALARCWPSGSATGTPRSTCPAWTCGACIPARARGPTWPTAPPSRWALLYQMHWPFRQVESARGARRTAFHDRLVAPGRLHGRAGWLGAGQLVCTAGLGARSTNTAGAGRTGSAHRRRVRGGDEPRGAVRPDPRWPSSSVQGRDACRVLNRLCTADVDVARAGSSTPSGSTNAGGIESDLTVTRLAEDRFMVVTTVARTSETWPGCTNHVADAFCTVTDVTSGLPDAGPDGAERSRPAARLTGADLSNEAFAVRSPPSRSRSATPSFARSASPTSANWAGSCTSRPSLRCTSSTALMAVGERHGLKLAGFHALNACRTEKGYRHWGHDIGIDDTRSKPALEFTCAWDKPGGFIGRDAVLRPKGWGAPKRLLQFKLDDPERPVVPRGADLRGRRTRWRDHLGHVRPPDRRLAGHGLRPVGRMPITADWIAGTRFEIGVGDRRMRRAWPSFGAWYDPKNERIRA